MKNVFRKITVAAVAGLLVVAMSDVAGAKPNFGGSCTGCHNNPGGDLTISPDPFEIELNDAGLLTFDVTDLGGVEESVISVQGLENVLLDASIGGGGDNWKFESGMYGMSYVSDEITALGLYTLDLGIGGLAQPGSYPIVVMFVGEGEGEGEEHVLRGMVSGFDLVVSAVPEPSTCVLAVVGLIGLGLGAGWRRKRS